MPTSQHAPSQTSLQETLKSIAERLHSTATVKTVFGEPIQTKDKTIIPVAKVYYGFWAGRGPELSTLMCQ